MENSADIMNIGMVAQCSGVPAKTIRYYESIGLITPAERKANGYRAYSAVDMRTLDFIKRARSLGFSVDQVRELLDLWRDRKRTSAAVKALASEHLKGLEGKIEELQILRRTLAHLIERCRGDTRPHCPIIDSLEGFNEARMPTQKSRSTTSGQRRSRSPKSGINGKLISSTTLDGMSRAR